MQTTLMIDDGLFAEATRLVSINNPNQLVELALTELIKSRRSVKKLDINDLVGKVSIDPNYNYKKLEELKERILLGVAEINKNPVIHQWKSFSFVKKYLNPLLHSTFL